MTGWKEVSVGDLGKIITGNTPPRKNPEYYGDHTIFIKPTDISEEQKFTRNPEECYSDLGRIKYKNSLIPKGSTCVVTIGSIGKKMTMAHTDCFINQAMNAIIPNENYDREFVYYLLKYNLPKLKVLDSGTASGRENVSKSSFSSIRLLVPPNRELQHKIGSILASYDGLIENNQKRIKLLHSLAQVQFRELNSLVHDRKEQELHELAEYLGRGVTPIYEEGSGFWAINQKANKGLSLETQHFKEYKSGDWIPKEKYAANGDVILNCLGEGTIGRCHFYKWEDNKFPVDQHMAIFRGKLPEIGLYVYQFLESDEGQAIIYSLKKGGTNMTMLNISDLRSLKILLPTKRQLASHYKQVEPLYALKAKLEMQNQRLKEARDILLPRLMSDEIDVEKTTVAEITSKSAIREAKMIPFYPITEEKETLVAEASDVYETGLEKDKWQFKEAVLIAVLTHKFGSVKYPLGRKRYTKLSYLFHRHAADQIARYARKAAGPYNPGTKYGGPEKIAQQNKYIVKHTNGKLEGFIASDRIADAYPYFQNYWSIEYLNWMEQFRYKKNDELELYATVDNAMIELHAQGQQVNVEAIKTIIGSEKEWAAKLEREIFSDANIQSAIAYLPTLYAY